MRKTDLISIEKIENAKSAKEVVELNRSQSVTGSQKHRDRRPRPHAITEQGVAMLSIFARGE